MKELKLVDLHKDREVQEYIRKANEYLQAIGFTEHGFRHVGLVSHIAQNILTQFGYPARTAELAGIAGYLHDIGNVISRHDHGISGALLAQSILVARGMSPEEVTQVIGAIGNHEEPYGNAVSPVAAALIIADKSDVHRTRVRNTDVATFDIHDRVNYAVEHSFVKIDSKQKVISLELTIDIKIVPVMEYFEIFLTRMIMCRKAADFLKGKFSLIINGSQLL